MTSLFRPPEQNTKQFSTFAHEIACYPAKELTPSHLRLIRWRKTQKLSKQVLLMRLSEDLTQYYFTDDPNPFQLRWIHDKVPTEFEWNSLTPEQEVFVDLRISPAIPNGGRIALLSLGSRIATPDSFKRPVYPPL